MVNKTTLEQSYLVSLFIRIAALNTKNHEDAKDIMLEIDVKLKEFPKEAILWCLRGLSQRRFWKLDYEKWIKDRVEHPENTIWYRRKINKDFTDKKSANDYFIKAIELDPWNQEYHKMLDLTPNDLSNPNL